MKLVIDDECLSEVFLSKQTCFNIDIFIQGSSDRTTEAAITLLTMGDIVLQSEIITEQGDGKNEDSLSRCSANAFEMMQLAY